MASTPRLGKNLIVDFAQTKAFNHDLAPQEATADCSDCVALVLAYSLRTAPLTVSFEDPQMAPMTLVSEKPQIRALQVFQDEPLVAHAIKAARAANATAVYVVAPSSSAEAESQAVREAALAAGATDVLAFDPQEAEASRVATRNFEICNVSAYVAKLGLDKLSACEGATSLLIMACDEPRITPHHLGCLVQRAQERPETEIVASWITWLRRLPLLFTPALVDVFDSLVAQRVEASASYVPLPQLCVEDVVFGEEMLAPSGSAPTGYQEFFAGLTLDALGAVRLAHTLAALDTADANAAAQRESLTAKLSEADKLLLSFAEETLAQSAANLNAEEAALVAKVSTWGQRNKQDFPLFADRKQRNHLVFLDTAATAQRCQQSLSAQYNFDAHENANVYRGAYDLSMQATFTLNDARAALENHLGAGRRETIFTSNTSSASNLIAQAWGDSNISKGDLIVVFQSDHHSNILPWLLLAERAEARLAYAPALPDGRIDQAAYQELLAQRPKLVCLTHVTNVWGLVNPVKELAAQAKEAGACVFVDGAQAAPHFAVNVKDLGIDFYALSAHKMYGPMGLGAVWVNPDRFAEMRPAAGGGGIISHESFESYYLRLGAIGYEVGTPAVSQTVGFAAALNYIDTLGMDAIQEHSSVLTRYLMTGLKHLEGISVWGDHECEDGAAGLVSLNVFGVAPAEVGVCLGKLGVAVRSGGHCASPLSALMGLAGTTRLSLGLYNTQEDIDAAVTALRACWHLYANEYISQK